jgi:multidrug resistance efflux pump
LLTWSFFLIRNQFTTIISEDAVINGALTDIKAPQAGMVSNLTLQTGDHSARGKSLLSLKNEQVAGLQVRSMKSKLNQQQALLKRAQAQLNRQMALLQVVTADQTNQYTLENLEAQQIIAKTTSELRGAEARLRLAQTNYQRNRSLQTEGAISQVNLEAMKVEMEQRQAEVDSIKNQLNILNTNQQAARSGLTIVNTRSHVDPRIRREELQMQIADQMQLVETLKQGVRDAEAELDQVEADVRKQAVVTVNAPVNGVVWRLMTQEGKFVQQGEKLGEVLDCNKRWIDAFVDEREVRSLQPGTPATITLYGANSQTLEGRVSLIRPGSGRLAPGEDITAIPAVPNLPRKAQVRVELASTAQRGGTGTFCYVGYTGKVSFSIR